MKPEFRAWDREQKIMHYWDTPKICDNGIFFEASAFDLGKGHNDDGEDDQPVMLFIGLKDKYGKKIYEGDFLQECTVGSIIWEDINQGTIVECPYGEVTISSCPIYANIRRVKTGGVKLKSGGFSELHLSTYDGVYTWPADIEVIGNKYQNPELLPKTL